MKLRITVKHNDIAREKINSLKNARMVVGWFKDTKYENNISVAQVAPAQEFGTKKIPARPFMRPARNENLEKWKEVFKNYLIKNNNIRAALDTLGLIVAGDIRQAIVNVTEPPLAPLTIQRRKARYAVQKFTASIAKPLIDTGLMISSVSHRTEEK